MMTIRCQTCGLQDAVLQDCQTSQEVLFAAVQCAGWVGYLDCEHRDTARLFCSEPCFEAHKIRANMITLVCWQCGKFYEMDEDPQTIYFGFHLSELTIKAGWKSYHDDDHGRLLIFCSEKCAEKARKKNGRFRLRAKKLVTKCPWCFGTGTIQYPHRDKLDKCPACGGKGSGTWYQDDISPPKVACSDALLSELGKPKKVTP